MPSLNSRFEIKNAKTKTRPINPDSITHKFYHLRTKNFIDYHPYSMYFIDVLIILYAIRIRKTNS